MQNRNSKCTKQTHRISENIFLMVTDTILSEIQQLDIKTDTEKEPPFKKMNVLYNLISLYCFEHYGLIKLDP